MILRYIETKGWYFIKEEGISEYHIPILIKDRRRKVTIAFPGIAPYKFTIRMILDTCRIFINKGGTTHSSLRRCMPIILWFCFINRLNFEVSNLSGSSYIQLKPEIIG